MKIRAKNGNLFTLTVERYEFPDEELGPTEDNPADEDFCTGRFLVVSHVLRNADGDWFGEYPTMTTNEFTRFIDWLDSVRRNEIETQGVYFTERCLEFSVNEPSTSIFVHLFWDFLPRWVDQGDTVVLDFPLAEIDLDAAINSLHQQSVKVPGRPLTP